VVTNDFITTSRGRDHFDRGIAAVDFSSSGILLLHGEESGDFLQRISTNDMTAWASGTARQTVLVTEKAKIVDAVIVVHLGTSMLMVTSPGESAVVKAWLERFIIMEDITVEDVTLSHVCTLVLGNPEKLSAAFPPRSGIDLPLSHERAAIPFSYFSHPAVLIISAAAEVMARELGSRSIPMASGEAFDAFRIHHGIPWAGKEINGSSNSPNPFNPNNPLNPNNPHNPLEAGLKQIVSFTKGCYIGQEVIARLDTYKKVQRLLCLVRLTPCPASGIVSEIIGENGIHGYITSITGRPDEDGVCRALAILRSPVVGARLTMENGSIDVVIEKFFE
jgi:tRNA-modifying protein YgfZ